MTLYSIDGATGKLAATAANIFSGEEMFCCLCQRVERSDRTIDSQWRCLEADGVPYYFCPRHFPPDPSPRHKFASAYKACLAEINRRRQLQASVNCIAAGQQLMRICHPDNVPDVHRVLRDRFGDWRRIVEVAGRQRIMPQELEVIGLVAEFKILLANYPSGAGKNLTPDASSPTPEP